MNVVIKEQGIKGLFKGWAPTMLGYSAQGAFKYGLYEFFKKYYSDIAGAEYAAKYKTLIYLAGSASAEVIADVALCPMEAVKVRLQTQPGFGRGLSDGLPKIVRSEGFLGYVLVSHLILDDEYTPSCLSSNPTVFFLRGLQFVQGHWTAMGTPNSL